VGLGTDPERTAFFFVTLPESLPIAVIRRFINWFTDFGIPVGGVVVNQVIEPGSQADMPEFVRNRVAMQAQHLDAIGEEFPGMVRGVLPLHDDEIRGVGELRATADELFGQRVVR
jgi:arsenite/tail-anchored protein-transporting ATPase